MDKRPMPSDLRDSGSLEQDASAVVFIYRDEIYNRDSKFKGLGEINVAINRNGTTGTDYYQFILGKMRVVNHTAT
jgi:replicative DNA helicase